MFHAVTISRVCSLAVAVSVEAKAHVFFFLHFMCTNTDSPVDCSEDQKDVCEEMTDLLKYAADNPPKSMVRYN